MILRIWHTFKIRNISMLFSYRWNNFKILTFVRFQFGKFRSKYFMCETEISFVHRPLNVMLGSNFHSQFIAKRSLLSKYLYLFVFRCLHSFLLSWHEQRKITMRKPFTACIKKNAWHNLRKRTRIKKKTFDIRTMCDLYKEKDPIAHNRAFKNKL